MYEAISRRPQELHCTTVIAEDLIAGNDVADHDARGAQRHDAAGTPVRTIEYPGARHPVFTLPGVVAQAGPARQDTAAFMGTSLP